MGAVCISKTDVNRYWHLKFQRFPDGIINSLHQFRGPGKALLPGIPKFHHQQLAFRGNTCILAAAIPSISCRDSRYRRPMSRGIYAWNQPSSLLQSRLSKRFVNLLLRVFCSNGIPFRRRPSLSRRERLIPQRPYSCGSICLPKILAGIIDPGIYDCDKNALSI